MAIVTKAIKPKKVRLDVFKLEILTGMNEVASGINKDFKATVATWDKQPTFQTLKSTRGGNLEIMVATDNEIYGYVDKGTRPHRIPKVGEARLAFPGGPYSAKTTPNVIGSQPGGSSGETAFARHVMHPGTKARNFDKIIQRKWQPRFKKRMQLAMKIAVNKSGHSI